jgi:hypothetical protein
MSMACGIFFLTGGQPLIADDGWIGSEMKMTAKEKSDLMLKLAELEAEDVNDNESTPPSPTPM